MNIIQFGHARHRVFSVSDLVDRGYSANTRLGSQFHFCVPCNLYTYGAWWEHENKNIHNSYVVCRQCNQASEKILS
jgi:hypothetical protein